VQRLAEEIQKILDELRTASVYDTELARTTDPLLLRIFEEENESDDSKFPRWNKVLASCIDHTLLRPDATPEKVETLCEEARLYNFASVCIHQSYVSICSEFLFGSAISVGTVIGFPLGASSTAVKVFEVETSAARGATEFDMVLHIGQLKAGNRRYVENDIARVVETAKEISPSNIVKVILETCLLTDEEKIAACLIAASAGADFVKTSTGFGTHGATSDDVALLRRVVGERMGVKASGGIRSFDDAITMLRSGANRIGTSSSVSIIHHLLH
jgi:deoxyribose-phosphate aldolase